MVVGEGAPSAGVQRLIISPLFTRAKGAPQPPLGANPRPALAPTVKRKPPGRIAALGRKTVRGELAYLLAVPGDRLARDRLRALCTQAGNLSEVDQAPAIALADTIPASASATPSIRKNCHLRVI
jgi:hypothetical protein